MAFWLLLLLGVGNWNFLEKDTDTNFNSCNGVAGSHLGKLAPISDGYQLTNGIFGGSWLL